RGRVQQERRSWRRRRRSARQRVPTISRVPCGMPVVAHCGRRGDVVVRGSSHRDKTYRARRAGDKGTVLCVEGELMQPVPSEPHFQTLRLYFDGCEAMAAYQRGDRRWRTFTAPDLILDRALKCRRLALTEGFIDFSDDQLNALETWPISDAQHALWRDEFVTMSSRGDDDNDLYGQRLPAQLYDL